MKATPTEPGRVVVSTQGHDKGRWYAVYSVIDDRWLLLVDGNARKLSKPKKKQCKHVRALPLTVAVTGQGQSGGALSDSDIRKAIAAARDAYLTKTGFAHTPARHDNEKEECAFVQK